MVGEKYNIEKAQEEAEKLRQKIDSGNAHTYSEAESQIEKDKEQQEIKTNIRESIAESYLLQKDRMDHDLYGRPIVEYITKLRKQFPQYDSVIREAVKDGYAFHSRKDIVYSPDDIRALLEGAGLFSDDYLREIEKEITVRTLEGPNQSWKFFRLSKITNAYPEILDDEIVGEKAKQTFLQLVAGGLNGLSLFVREKGCANTEIVGLNKVGQFLKQVREGNVFPRIEEKFFSTPEFLEAARKGVYSYVENKINDYKRYNAQYDISLDSLSDFFPEVNQFIADKDYQDKIYNRLANLENEMVSDSEKRRSIELGDKIRLARDFHLEEARMNRIKEIELMKLLSPGLNRNFSYFLEKIKEWDIPENIKKKEEIQERAISWIVSRGYRPIRKGELSVLDLAEVVNLPKAVWEKPEMLQYLWFNIKNNHYADPTLESLKILREYSTVVAHLLCTMPEVRQIAVQIIQTPLVYGEFNKVAYIRESFELTNDELEASFRKEIASLLSRDEIEFGRVEALKKELGLSLEFGKEESKAAMIEKIGSERFRDASQIQKVFELPDDTIFELFSQALKEQKWKTLVAMQVYFESCRALYINLVSEQKQRISVGEPRERKEAIIILAGLAENGDHALVKEFTGIIANRATSIEAPDTKTGLEPAQEAAFVVLRKMDNPDSNKAIFNLALNDAVAPAVKRSALIALTKHPNFLNYAARQALTEWLEKVTGKKTDYRDLQYIKALDGIPSTELRLATQNHIADGMSMFHDYELTASGDDLAWQKIYGIHEWATTHPDVPPEAVLALNALRRDADATAWQNNIMPKFDRLYSAIKKESTKKADLLYGIVACLDTRPELRKLLITKLAEVDFGAKQHADALSGLFRQLVFLDKFDTIVQTRTSNDGEEDYDEENYQEEAETNSSAEAEQPAVDTTVKDIFARPAHNLAELSSLLNQVITEKAQRVLPHPEITAKKIQQLQEAWHGDLEPIFTYVGRYPNNKQYIAEMVAHFDSPERWQAWRYDMDKKVVKGQIGHLTPEQRAIWQANYAAELGDVLIAQSTVNKPTHIRTLLADAIVRDRHIYNPEAGFTKCQTIQEILETTHAEAQATPDQGPNIFDAAIGELKKDTEQLDVIIKAAAIPKIHQMLEKNLPVDGTVRYNAPTNTAVSELASWLPKDLAEKLAENYRQVDQASEKKEEKQKPTDAVLESSMREAIAAKIKAVAHKAQEVTVTGTVFDKYGLDKNSQKNLGPYYQKRQELKAAIDLLRLSSLNNRRIATNRITEHGTQKEGGETITTVLENLKKFFKDSPLLQDLKNIEFTLKEEQKFGEKRRLAMIITDNPQMTWQAGKYPLGNGSCQHYAEGSMAESLMGYVGDAHLKAAYLLDVNVLPAQYQELFKTHSISEAILQHIPAQELLNASLARSIVKVGKGGKSPVIFLAPTYSVVNKGDASMDSYFNMFTNLFLAEPMKVAMTRGVGNDMVQMPASRNPDGQYEDGAEGDAGNAGMGIQHGTYTVATKIIGKDHTPTAEEMAMAERMRASSEKR